MSCIAKIKSYPRVLMRYFLCFVTNLTCFCCTEVISNELVPNCLAIIDDGITDKQTTKTTAEFIAILQLLNLQEVRI